MLDKVRSTRNPVAIGIDTGGTHTDVVLVNGNDVRTLKVPTTPEDLNVGILDGIEKICSVAGVDVAEVSRFAYATTYVTNLIVEEKETSVALLTTEGFRDVLEIGRASRKPDVYDIHWRPAPPLVPRHLRFVAKERMDYRGQPILPLDEADVRTKLQAIKASGVKSLAVCLMHAYANPAHEARIAQLAAEICPEIDVSLSSDVVREFREYERTSTTCVNAFIKKAIGEHLRALESKTHERGMSAGCYIMRGNGGLSTFDRASELAAAITHSGVMGGIVGATALAAQCGIDSIITLDMGGTSTDVALITNGAPSMTHQSRVGPYPLLVPTLDMVTIGAGGGSLAYIEGQAALRVGPRSAGSVPGPACYGQGGDCPTVTDANLYTGRLNPEFFLAGKRKLYPEKSSEALHEKLSKPLGIEAADVAVGILSIAEAHMTNAIRLVSVERGLDPRDFTLVAFGGAGALHAVRLAEALGIKKVLIPPAPGNLSAMGLLCADVRHDFARTMVASLTDDVTGKLRATVAELLEQARLALEGEGVISGHSQFSTSVDLRYQGQNYELNLPLVNADLQGQVQSLIERFGRQHQRVYGYLLKGKEIQVVNVRVTATGFIEKAAWPSHDPAVRAPQVFAQRELYLEGRGWVSANVYRFQDLQVNHVIDGPAVVEYPGSTLFLAPDWEAQFDQFKCAHLTYLAGKK
ncbi:MAG: hydantoinase/oxoprolinase family protein [Burkholderiales bacterium]|nr:hydantoinase/oxoprolinase family protein [Burkholderiales bacterium]